MANIIVPDSKIIVGEQSDGSLVYPDGSKVTVEQREIIVGNSLSTPIRQEESKIKDVIKNSIASIIIAETGSGKTTELQQMIHEVYPNDIVITNIPLVASTIGTATYVSDVLYAKTGNPNYLLGMDLIGYRTGRGNSSERRTLLTNNTFGLDYLNVSLGNFESNLNLTNKNYHIILDEIHEKGEDFIFYLKKILEISKKHPGRVKLYGASATISEDYLNLLVDKFSILSKDIPTLKIDGRTHPIESKEDNGADLIKKSVEIYNAGRSLLIFQPGKSEIERTINELKDNLGQDISIYPFHSDISSDELQNILSHNDERKIFVATNAARTGVTLDISGVIDLGLQKNLYYNKSGVPILNLENITKDAQKQNEGRAGRKEPGVAIYTGRTKIEDLRQEAPSSVEIKVDEKKILMELLSGENILDNESNEEHKYLYKPNIGMLNVSYKWMKKAGLMSDDEKLTDYGFEVLKLPVSVFSGRIILESIANGVSKEVIPMVCIIENDGFINKKFDFARFPNDFILSDYSDLESQLQILNLLTSREADDSLLNVFVNLGVSRSSVEIFKNLGGKVKLYEQIKDDLEKIGINYKSIVKIDSQIEKINTYLLNNKVNIQINEKVVEKSIDDKEKIISRTLLSGYLHFVYKYIGNKKLKDISGENTDIEFLQSEISKLNLEEGSLYIGQPFIIGGNGDKQDLELLSFLTKIDPKHLEYYSSREYSIYKSAESYSPESFPSDVLSDTYSTPSHLIDVNDKKKFLAKTWLPHFLMKENPFFKNMIDSNPEMNKEKALLKLSFVTLKHHDKIDPFDKQATAASFIEDDTILRQFYDTSDESFDLVEDENIELGNSEFYNYMLSVSEYNKVLNDAQKYINGKQINTNQLKDKYLSEIILLLGEKNDNYRNLLIFIKNLLSSPDKNKIKKELKEEEKSLKRIKDKLLKIKKRNGWLNSFIISLENLISGKNTDFYGITNGTHDSKDLLLRDSTIKGTSIIKISNGLNLEFKYISKAINKLDIYGYDLSKLNLSLQRMLYIDDRKYKRGQRGFSESLKKLGNIKKSLIERRENLSGFDSYKLNLEKKSINKQINIINTLVAKANNFKSSCLEIRKIIKSINFEDFIFSDNQIYTEKFLYNVLIDVIFEGNILYEDLNKQELKLKSKLDSIVGNKDISIDDLILFISSYINKSGSSKIKDKLEKIINILKQNLDTFVDEEIHLSNSVLDLSSFNSIFNDVKGLIESIFPIGYVSDSSLNQNKLLNFAKQVKDLDIGNFDKELKKLIIKLGSKNIVAYGQIFKDLEEYEYLSSELNGYDNIDSTYFRTELSIENEDDNYDFEKDREKVLKRTEDIKVLTRVINTLIQKLNS